jgi:hypothetical protein
MTSNNKSGRQFPFDDDRRRSLWIDGEDVPLVFDGVWPGPTIRSLALPRFGWHSLDCSPRASPLAFRGEHFAPIFLLRSDFPSLALPAPRQPFPLWIWCIIDSQCCFVWRKEGHEVCIPENVLFRQFRFTSWDFYHILAFLILARIDGSGRIFSPFVLAVTFVAIFLLQGCNPSG